MTSLDSSNTLLVGNGGVEHVGEHLRRAAQDLGLPVSFADVREAYGRSALQRRLNWWLRGRRPSRLGRFSERVLKLAVQEGSKCLLTTGIAPLNAECLQKMGERKIWKSNFLTDDPWNPALYAPWFLEALPHYDVVYSPRKANMDQLRGLGCRSVEYLPFAYSRHIHFEVDPQYRESAPLSDVVFAGGADRDRLPWISALLRKGLSVALYGGYWERYPETRSSARGNADPATLRGAIAGASVALCLVRKANRDGHAMRTFEVPAMKAAMVVERTADHMDLFGVEGNAVCYFDSVPEMIEKVVWLLERPAERFRLAESAHRLIVNGGHTYHDRLQTMLSRVGETVVA